MMNLDVKLYTPYIPAPSSSPTTSTSPIPSGQTSNIKQAEMKMLRLYSPEDLKNCPLDKWGILDPGLIRRDTITGEKREDGMLPSIILSGQYNSLIDRTRHGFREWRGAGPDSHTRSSI
jgi:hypothetical protein